MTGEPFSKLLQGGHMDFLGRQEALRARHVTSVTAFPSQSPAPPSSTVSSPTHRTDPLRRQLHVGVKPPPLGKRYPPPRTEPSSLAARSICRFTWGSNHLPLTASSLAHWQTLWTTAPCGHRATPSGPVPSLAHWAIHHLPPSPLGHWVILLAGVEGAEPAHCRPTAWALSHSVDGYLNDARSWRSDPWSLFLLRPINWDKFQNSSSSHKIQNSVEMYIQQNIPLTFLSNPPSAHPVVSLWW